MYIFGITVESRLALKERYISPEERQKIINELRLA